MGWLRKPMVPTHTGLLIKGTTWLHLLGSLPTMLSHFLQCGNFSNFVSILMKEKFIFKSFVLSYFTVNIQEKTSQETFNVFLRKSFNQTSDHIATFHKHQDTNTMQPCFLLLQNTNDLSSISSIISFCSIALSSFPSKTSSKWPSPLISLPTFSSWPPRLSLWILRIFPHHCSFLWGLQQNCF